MVAAAAAAAAVAATAASETAITSTVSATHVPVPVITMAATSVLQHEDKKRINKQQE